MLIAGAVALVLSWVCHFFSSSPRQLGTNHPGISLRASVKSRQGEVIAAQEELQESDAMRGRGSSQWELDERRQKSERHKMEAIDARAYAAAASNSAHAEREARREWAKTKAVERQEQMEATYALQLKTARKKAKAAEDCFDRNVNCRKWERLGECKRNPEFMLHDCMVSCGVCVETFDPSAIVASREYHHSLSIADNEEAVKSIEVVASSEVAENMEVVKSMGVTERSVGVESADASGAGDRMVKNTKTAESSQVGKRTPNEAGIVKVAKVMEVAESLQGAAGNELTDRNRAEKTWGVTEERNAGSRDMEGDRVMHGGGTDSDDAPTIEKEVEAATEASTAEPGANEPDPASSSSSEQTTVPTEEPFDKEKLIAATHKPHEGASPTYYNYLLEAARHTAAAQQDKSCRDENTECITWQLSGECQRNPRYMLHACKAACGVCINHDEA